MRFVLKFWTESGLFADFVSGDSIECTMPFYRNSLVIVGINRVFLALSQQIKAVRFQIRYQIASFNRHVMPLQVPAPADHHQGESHGPAAYRPISSR
jgi:hypothetical protein